MNLEQLKAAAQAVVDAQDATTHAIIAPSAEAFSGSWLINTSHVPHVVYPTHWQPLPTPPQEQSHD